MGNSMKKYIKKYFVMFTYEYISYYDKKRVSTLGVLLGLLLLPLSIAFIPFILLAKWLNN